MEALDCTLWSTVVVSKAKVVQTNSPSSVGRRIMLQTSPRLVEDHGVVLVLTRDTLPGGDQACSVHYSRSIEGRLRRSKCKRCDRRVRALPSVPVVLTLPAGPRIERLSQNKDTKHSQISSLDYFSIQTYHLHACLPSGSARIPGRRLPRLLPGLHFAMAVPQHPARPAAERRGIHLQCPGFRTARLLHSHMLHRPGPHPE